MTATVAIASQDSTAATAQIKKNSRVFSLYSNYWRIALDLLNRCTLKPLCAKYEVILLKPSDPSYPTLQYIGDGGQFSYLKSLVYKDTVDQIEGSQRRTISLLDLLRKKLPDAESEITVLDFDFALQNYLNVDGTKMPHWLKQKINLEGGWDSYLSGMRRKTRREAQRMIRKFELTTNLVSGAVYGPDFYDELYKPYISSRHGDSSVIIERPVFLGKIKHSQIMRLMYQGKVIAAAQIDNDGSTLSLGWTGVHDSDDRELRGAADALDYFCVKHAFDTGCTAVDMGHSRPVLSDGILKYKKKWRAAVNMGVVPQGSFVFQVNAITSASKRFFVENPILSKGSGGLTANLLVEDAKEGGQEWQALFDDVFIDGIQCIRVSTVDSQLRADCWPAQCELEINPYGSDEELLQLFKHL